MHWECYKYCTPRSRWSPSYMLRRAQPLFSSKQIKCTVSESGRMMFWWSDPLTLWSNNYYSTRYAYARNRNKKHLLCVEQKRISAVSLSTNIIIKKTQTITVEMIRSMLVAGTGGSKPEVFTSDSEASYDRALIFFQYMRPSQPGFWGKPWHTKKERGEYY